MRGAAKAWIVGAERHLDPIQNPFIDDHAFLNKRLCRFLDGHAHRGIVVGRADDQVHFGQHAALICPIVMCQRAARGLDNAHAFGWLFGGDGVEVG